MPPPPLVEIGLRWLPKLGVDTSPRPHATDFTNSSFLRMTHSQEKYGLTHVSKVIQLFKLPVTIKIRPKLPLGPSINNVGNLEGGEVKIP